MYTLCVYTMEIQKMNHDFFDELVWCKDCRTEMKKVIVSKDGFQLRALQCPKCGKRIYHPQDSEELKKFSQLKQRPFEVKLRMVGNSYAVSIPREIIDFMQAHENQRFSGRRKFEEFSNEQEAIHNRLKNKMNEMVKLSLEESGRISLNFGKEVVRIEHRDSANPEKNKSITIEKVYTNQNGKPQTNVKIMKEENKIKNKQKINKKQRSE